MYIVHVVYIVHRRNEMNRQQWNKHDRLHEILNIENRASYGGWTVSPKLIKEKRSIIAEIGDTDAVLIRLNRDYKVRGMK